MMDHGARARSRGGRGRWTSIIGSALALKLAARRRRLANTRQWSQDSGRVQLDTLRSLLERAAETEIGRELGFRSLVSRFDRELLKAYRSTVPLADYEGFRERLTRMREGAEPDILWPGIVRDWAETSGTTGGQKFIPVSQEMMKSNFKASLDIFAHAQKFGIPLNSMFAGRMLFLGGSTDVQVNEHGIRTGDLSGIVTSLIRWPLSEVYSPGPDIALMSDWPAKMDAMAELAARQDIRFVSGMASWSLVLFEKVIEIARKRDPGVRTLRDVWPNFKLFVHGGVKYEPFRPRVCRAWSGDEGVDVPHRLEVYPASEGFIAVQDEPGDPGLRLHTDIDIFYEFVPVEDIDKPDARGFACDEVDTGQRYVVVMSTCAGLWRYIIGDVVEFDTVPDRSTRGGQGLGPPRLRIVGRHKHFVNAFGENLIVEDIERAVVAAQRAASLTVGEFTAAPVYPSGDTRAGLELAIEIESKDGPGALSRFGEVFDAELRTINVDYNTKRTGDLGMAPPVITSLPLGAFHRWMEGQGKLGGQHKAPRCANTRDILEGVKQAAGSGE